MHLIIVGVLTAVGAHYAIKAIDRYMERHKATEEKSPVAPIKGD